MFRKDGAGRQADDRRDALASGARAEDQALAHLLSKGLRLVERNYRVARGPSKRGGEIDLIMLARDGTLVFVEVRARGDASHGGAAASISFHTNDGMPRRVGRDIGTTLGN